MTSRKTCDKCQHYTPTNMPSTASYVHAGNCALMKDANKGDVVVDIDKVSGWDYESYVAGTYVGPKFGCIHWAKANA